MEQNNRMKDYLSIIDKAASNVTTGAQRAEFYESVANAFNYLGPLRSSEDQYSDLYILAMEKAVSEGSVDTWKIRSLGMKLMQYSDDISRTRGLNYIIRAALIECERRAANAGNEEVADVIKTPYDDGNKVVN